jgi:hypothetical protein
VALATIALLAPAAQAGEPVFYGKAAVGTVAGPVQFATTGGTVVLVKASGSVIASLSGASGTSVQEGKLPTSLKVSFVQSHTVQHYTHFMTGPSQQLTFVLTEFPHEPPFGECVCTHEAPAGVSTTLTLKSTPIASALGVTK